jgi:hypothetical protein
MTRGSVDLGSVMVRAALYATTNLRFLADAIFTRDLFLRDFRTVEQLLDVTTPERVQLIHQCLLLHQ